MPISFTRRTLAPALLAAFLAAAAISLVLVVSPSFVASALKTTEDSVAGIADDECDDLILTLTISDSPAYPVVEIQLPASASAGFVSFRRDDENLIISVEVWDAAPTLSTPTASGADVSAAFTRSTVASLGSHHYVFEIHKSDTSDGTYSFKSSITTSTSPAVFDDVDRGKWYKTRAKRCEASDGKVCGTWSSLTSAVEVWEGAPPPTSLSLALTQPNTLTATFTQSTWSRSSHHYYLIQLQRSETSGGEYTDYPPPINGHPTPPISASTSPAAMGKVHTAYYYKVQAQRCETSARTNCGSWSTPSSAVNVPATSAAAPTLMALTLSDHDNLSVSFTRASSAPRSPPATHAVQLLVSESRSGTYTPGVTGTSATTAVKFSNVKTNKYYKARGRSCADTAGKLCGPWGAMSSSVNVPTPTFPALTAPTITASTDNGTVAASFSLPSAGYTYIIALRWSELGSTYGAPTNAKLEFGDTAHTFTGLIPANGGYYKTELKACTDAGGESCGSEVTSNVVRLSTLSIDKAGDIWFLENGNTSITATSANLITGEAYQVQFAIMSTGSGGQAIRFNACNDGAASIFETKDLAATNRNTSWTPTSVSLYVCSVATPTLKISLLSGSTEIASVRRRLNVLVVPSELRANGDSRDPSGTGASGDTGSDAGGRSAGVVPPGSGPRFVLRWGSVAGASSYKIRYAEGFDDSGNAIADASKTRSETTQTAPQSEKTTTGLTINKIYEVQVKSVGHGLTTGWSSPIYVKTTRTSPNFGMEKFAKIELTEYLSDGVYRYTLCSNRFVDATAANPASPSTWISDVKSAIETWKAEVIWMTGAQNIVGSVATTADCEPAHLMPDSDRNVVFLASNYKELQDMCGLGEMNTTTIACVLSSYDGTTHANSWAKMIFRSTKDVTDWNPGQYANDPDRCSKLYQTALHEAGHAFGLGHTTVENSIMIKSPSPSLCRVTSVDVAAIMRIYQTPPP